MSKALGTELVIASTTIGNLTSINGIEISADTQDVTTMDSPDGYREFITTLIDGGEVTADGIMKDKGVQAATIIALIGSDTASACTVTYPSGAEWGFNAVVTGFSTSAELESAVEFSLTLKVSGKPTFTAGGSGS